MFAGHLMNIMTGGGQIIFEKLKGLIALIYNSCNI